MEKSPEAFRTISEVADLLDTPAHVLRFWESRFPQIRPVKRAGGRRYYRPGDVALLAGIKKLLHDDGLTIRGVQKILREQGIRHVAGLAAPLPDPMPGTAVTLDETEEAAGDEEGFILSALAPAATPTETAQIIPLDQAFARQDAQRAPVAPLSVEEAEAPPAAGAAQELVPAAEGDTEAPFIEAEEEVELAESLPLFAQAARRPVHVPDAAADPASVEPSEAAVPEAEPKGDESTTTTVAETPVADMAATDASADAAAPVDEPELPSQPTLAALLRRSRRARLAPHRAELERLQHRLADLRDRVAEAARRRIR